MLTRLPNSPHLNPIEHLLDALDKQVQSMEALPRNLQVFKDLRCARYHSITFSGLLESVPRRVRAVSVAKGRPTGSKAFGDKVTADRWMCKSMEKLCDDCSYNG